MMDDGRVEARMSRVYAYLQVIFVVSRLRAYQEGKQSGKYAGSEILV